MSFFKSRPRRFAALGALFLLLVSTGADPRADSTAQSLPFFQDWSDTSLITTNDDWSGVPGIVGYRGDGLAAGTGVDPSTILADGTATPVDVNVGQGTTFATGGVAEFDALANPVVALQGSGTARAPFLLVSVSTLGKQNITVSYNLRDVDAVDNSVQPVALQYRVGNSGSFTNIPAGFVADASLGGSATLVTPVSAPLPVAAENQALVQLRIITTDAVGSDEWIGIDDISITSSAAVNPSATTSVSPGIVTPGTPVTLSVAVTPGQNPASTGLSVSADLSSIGGSASQQFFDDGNPAHGDAAAGDRTFSFIAAVATGAGTGNKAMPVTVTDAEGRTVIPPPTLALAVVTTLPLFQDWTDRSLITLDDDWSGVTGIVGYRGDALTSGVGVNPATIVADGTAVVDVNANEDNPNSFTTGGVAEFDIPDPVVALAGSGTAKAPFLLFSVSTMGQFDIRMQYTLRDVDGSGDDAVQPVALQYRVGNSGDFTNVPEAFVADASQGPNLAGQSIPVDVLLPAAVNNQPLVQIRVVTTDAVGSDEWIGIDDIAIFSPTSPSSPRVTEAMASPNPVQYGNATLLSATALPGTNPASTALAVSCNLAAIGGSSSFALSTSAGNVFSAFYTVPPATPPAAYVLPCAATDGEGRSGLFTISLTVVEPLFCDPPIRTSTAIHSIQGGGLQSPVSGALVEVEGIVVADFRASTQLAGFYLQEPADRWDSDAGTSEGVFVFDAGLGLDVNVGDRVRVRGTVAEFLGTGSFLGSNRSSTLTEIVDVQNKAVCSTGNPVTPVPLTLPLPSLEAFEQYEGMAVAIEQRLAVTGNFSLGLFGQVDLAPAPLFVPTHSADRTTWAAQAALIPRSVIALDDASTLANANLFPTLFPQGGLSAGNTLRVGDLVNYDAGSGTTAPLVGVLDDRFGAYRIHPTAPVTFHAANPRPTAAPLVSAVAGRFRAVNANVLNFFTTFGSRGAANQTEFEQQKTKIVEALIAMSPDLIGLSEVQNYSDGQTDNASNTQTNGPLQSLVDGLNCRFSGQSPLCTSAPSQPFAFIDVLPNGATNDTDAIRNAILYRADRLQPIGAPALTNLTVTGNRASLAQTFQPAPGTGLKLDRQKFTFVVNHFRSKGSACGSGLDDPLQGNCNGRRLAMAEQVVSWLAANPTADPTADRKLLLVGDLNAYLGEDPIQFLIAQGYTNLVDTILGPSAYSYNFGSQRGYLDHALANGAMNVLVKSIAEWHTNADEPSSLQALDSADKSPAAQAAYYAPDPFAAADHDPILIGFNTLTGDLNDDGVVDVADQRLMTAANGKPASQADRRMDYDGDGRITLNDYRLWNLHYRAYLQ